MARSTFAVAVVQLANLFAKAVFAVPATGRLHAPGVAVIVALLFVVAGLL
jgi:hypothetical protein